MERKRRARSRLEGRLLWEVRHPDHHHDGIALRNANVLLPCLAQLPLAHVPKVKGGMAGTERNGEMYADYLVEMTTGEDIVGNGAAGNTLILRRIGLRRFRSGAKNGRMAMALLS